MSDWRAQMSSAVADFVAVAQLAGDTVSSTDLAAEYLVAPHRPSGLPTGKMAIYAFWAEGEWLKIGKVGANSDARYRSQHYAFGRARSSLANSLCNDTQMVARTGITPETCTDWIKTHTHRCNLLISVQHPKSLLSLLESFLHHRLRPRYEG